MPVARAGDPGRVTPQRLFFALWPEPELQRELGRRAQAIERASGGRATRTENIHLTLVFLGEVTPERAAAVRAAAAATRAEQCTLVLDRAGYWKHNRIAWAGASEVPRALVSLVATLEERLAASGFATERRPYVPHVTLVRKARAAEPARFDRLAWPYREFVLVESVREAQGARYAVIGRWRLDAPAA